MNYNILYIQELGKKFYILCLAVLAMAFVACSKEDLGSDFPYITFGVSGTGTDTKGLITNDSFASNAVYMYGVRNNTNSIYSATPITPLANSNNWAPAENLRRKWVAGSSYSFYAYTCSPLKLGAAPTGSDSGVYVDDTGMKITVSQPSEYDEDDMVDFMLSHAYKVADGANYHTVMLYMEHAMAWVEVVVEKEMPEHTVTLKSIVLSKIFRSAVMQCESQAIANAGNSNVWTTALQGENTLSYTKNSFSPSGNTIGTMSILAVPQQLSSSTELTVSYSVKESESSTKDYTQTFKLYNYSPYVWESGHKIKYKLTINTGADLQAYVEDWKDAGYTEGIILPPA